MDQRSVILPGTGPIGLDFTHSVDLSHYSEGQVEALERDLALAAQIQRHLFPCCVPALTNLKVAAHLKPAGIVSGDFFDFFCYKDEGQGMLIADIMGKGIPASLLMASIQATMRVLGPEYGEVHSVVARLNTLFRHQVTPGVFASMVVLAYEPDIGQMTYSNAGHLPPLLWRNKTKQIEWLKPTGPAIGLMNEPIYESRSIDLESGDIVLLYTDGLVEARDENEEEFDTHRLAAFMHDYHDMPPRGLIGALHEELYAYTKGELSDDLTLLVLKKD